MRQIRFKLSAMMCVMVLICLDCDLSIPPNDYYTAKGITIYDLSGYWFNGDKDFFDTSKTARELLVFGLDSGYYKKIENDPPDLFLEEYGNFSIGGSLNETVFMNCKRRFSIIKYANGTIDTVDTRDQPSQLSSSVVNMRTSNGKLIEYYRVFTPDGIIISDLVTYAKVDSSAAELQMWEKIPKP